MNNSQQKLTIEEIHDSINEVEQIIQKKVYLGRKYIPYLLNLELDHQDSNQSDFEFNTSSDSLNEILNFICLTREQFDEQYKQFIDDWNQTKEQNHEFDVENSKRSLSVEKILFFLIFLSLLLFLYLVNL